MVVRHEVTELVLDHRFFSLAPNATRRRPDSPSGVSTSRRTFTTTFQGLASLAVVPELRREPRDAVWFPSVKCRLKTLNCFHLHSTLLGAD
jgi:hypothetical protein